MRIVTLRPYRIVIGTKTHTRYDFGCMAESKERAREQYIDLCEPGESPTVIPVGDYFSSFSVDCKRNELAQAELREADRFEDINKSQRRHAISDRAALELQVNGGVL